MKVFLSPEDYRLYRKILAEQVRRNGVRIWLHCQMPNHVHLIAEPSTPASLSKAIGEAHRLYARSINGREGWCGHLWQARFRSFPMDDLHLLRAVSYILFNPVRAGLVSRPEDWPHSSARAHLGQSLDDLITSNALDELIDDWPVFLEQPVSSATLETFRRHSSTGRPLGNSQFQRLISSRV